jgi:hypothetical protein
MNLLPTIKVPKKVPLHATGRGTAQDEVLAARILTNMPCLEARIVVLEC